MMKRTIGAGGVFLDASGIGLSESVAVGALGVADGLCSLCDFETPQEEEEGCGEDGNVVGVTQIPCLFLFFFLFLSYFKFCFQLRPKAEAVSTKIYICTE